MNKTKLSKWLSYVLRHEPESINLSVDKRGWANVSELLAKANNSLTIEILEEIVTEDDKQRYSFNEDETMIRANQGHSRLTIYDF